MFRSFFTDDAVAPVFSNAPNDYRATKDSIRRYRGYSFYAGHYGHNAFKCLGDGHHLVTNFRDPVERIVSLYRYWRNNVSASQLESTDPRDAAIVLLSHKLQFSDFIRLPNEDLRLYISNFHFRQLLFSPWETPTIQIWHASKVKRRISRMPWFYIAEMPSASVALLRREFPELSSGDLPKDNISIGEPVQLRLEDAQYLVRLNRLDYLIYQHALREQIARLIDVQST